MLYHSYDSWLLTFMFSPSTITRSNIMDAREIFKLVQGDLFRWDAKFVFQFTLSCSTGPCIHLHNVSHFEEPVFLIEMYLPNWFSSTNSDGVLSGWEQQVLVHMLGNVIFSGARCWSKSRFSESNKNTLNARCKRPWLIFSIKWPKHTSYTWHDKW